MNPSSLSSTLPLRQRVIGACDAVARLCHAVAALAVLVMLTLVVIQVVFRYLFNTPLGWTQELSVFSLMLAVMSGMAVAFWRGEHFRVSVFVDLLPSMLGKAVSLIAQLVTVVFLAVVVWFSYALAMRAMMQVSPTTGIPIGYVQLFLTGGSLISALLLTVKTLWGNGAAAPTSPTEGVAP